MTLEELISFFTNLASEQDIIVKTILVLLLILFTLFAIILARQISVLSSLINQVSFTPVFKFIAYSVVLTSLALLVAIILV